MDFLEQLETKRGNTASTRNARLAAIRSFMRFCECREPAILEQSRRILAIPFKRTDIALINHLSIAEMEAILNARTSRCGQEYATGLCYTCVSRQVYGCRSW